MSLDYMRSVNWKLCAVTLTMVDGRPITVNLHAIAYVAPRAAICTDGSGTPMPGAVVNFGGQPDGGLIVQEPYEAIRRLMRGNETGP